MEGSTKFYPVLEGKIAERGIMKKAIAARIGISYRAFMARLSGEVDFQWQELKIMQSVFFPDISKEDLMRTERE